MHDPMLFYVIFALGFIFSFGATLLFNLLTGTRPSTETVFTLALVIGLTAAVAVILP